MNTRKLFVVMMVVCLPVVLMATLTEAPELVTVGVGETAIDLAWTEVTGAVKYSVDIYGTVTFTDETPGEVEVSFGTPGLSLSITIEELADAIAAELGVDVATLDSFDGWVKVKGLNPPSKENGPQNNPFSDPEPLQVDFPEQPL